MNLIPAFVVSYNQAARTCTVRVPYSDETPVAEFCYPMGDKSEHTEIEILEGDRVWLAFINGDQKYPVIMGYRPKRKGNAPGWRKYHHQNIELNAAQDVKVIVGGDYEVTVTGEADITADGDVLIESSSKVTLVVGGSTVELTDGNITLTTTTINLNSVTVTLDGQLIVNGMTTLNGGMTSSVGGMGGLAAVFNGDIEVDGKSFLTHQHYEMGDGNLVGPPV